MHIAALSAALNSKTADTEKSWIRPWKGTSNAFGQILCTGVLGVAAICMAGAGTSVDVNTPCTFKKEHIHVD